MALIATAKGTYQWSIPPIPDRLSDAFLELASAIAGINVNKDLSAAPMTFKDIHEEFSRARQMPSHYPESALARWLTSPVDDRPALPGLTHLSTAR